MRFFETLYEESGKIAWKNGRLAVVLSAVAFVLHFVEAKVEKISIGGSEVVIREPYVLKGALGLVLIYLLLSAFAYAATHSWAGNILDPSSEKIIKSVRGRYYYLSTILASIVGAIEFGLTCGALFLCWSDMVDLVAAIIARAVG